MLEQGSWKLERAKIVEAVEKLINDSGPPTDDNQYFKMLESKNKSNSDPSLSSVILIDDNNYLQSMRYEYYQMARKYTLGFSQLYFDCSTDVAKKLNNSRSPDSQVPDEVITKMAAKMEQPNPFNNKWEAFSFTVKVDVDNDIIEDSFDMIKSVIDAATDNPVQEIVPKVSEEEREKDRVACDASVIHQADKCLRSFVNKRMFAMKQSGLSKEEMNAASKHVYKVKTEVLEDLKTGHTKLDRNLVTSVQNRDPESVRMLESDLNNIFQQKLALQ